MNNKIIVLNNNDQYARFLQELLFPKGYEVLLSDTEFTVLEQIAEHNPCLIITSYNLTQLDGETFYKTIYSKYPELPVLFISNVRDEDIITSIISYPNCEFMVKPVIPEELIARIKILTGEEPIKNENNEFLKFKNIEIDRKSKVVKKNGEEIALTPTEYRLLEYLMLSKNTVLSRAQILNQIWGTSEDVTDRIVDVYIVYIREKIDREGCLIQTVQGFGYKFTD